MGLIPELDTSLVTDAGLNETFGATRLLVIIQKQSQSRPTGGESYQVRQRRTVRFKQPDLPGGGTFEHFQEAGMNPIRPAFILLLEFGDIRFPANNGQTILAP